MEADQIADKIVPENQPLKVSEEIEMGTNTKQY